MKNYPVEYHNTLLHRTSHAYLLYQAWQSAKTDRNQLQRQLDKHMQELEANHRETLNRYNLCTQHTPQPQ